jgi:hypothetical protein
LLCQLIDRLSGAHQFAMMRIESNQARGTFQQLRIAVRLTSKLYALYYRIEAIKSRLEVCFTPLSLPLIQSIMASQLAVDEQQIAIADPESTTGTIASVTQSVCIYHVIWLKDIHNHDGPLSYCFSHNPDLLPLVATLLLRPECSLRSRGGTGSHEAGCLYVFVCGVVRSAFRANVILVISLPFAIDIP